MLQNVVHGLNWAADELMREFTEIRATPESDAGREIIEHVATLRRAADILDLLGDDEGKIAVDGVDVPYAVTILRRAVAIVEKETGLDKAR